jgi:hypothetical protein
MGKLPVVVVQAIAVGAIIDAILPHLVEVLKSLLSYL